MIILSCSNFLERIQLEKRRCWLSSRDVASDIAAPLAISRPNARQFSLSLTRFVCCLHSSRGESPVLKGHDFSRAVSVIEWGRLQPLRDVSLGLLTSATG